jgi:mRNA interferase MazF
MPAADRGEVWLVDLGMAAKVRPCLVLGVPSNPADRALVGIVPHTTSLHGTRFEVAVPKPFLKAGAFDAQGVAPVPRVKLIRRIGVLMPDELATVEAAVRSWLGL